MEIIDVLRAIGSWINEMLNSQLFQTVGLGLILYETSCLRDQTKNLENAIEKLPSNVTNKPNGYTAGELQQAYMRGFDQCTRLNYEIEHPSEEGDGNVDDEVPPVNKTCK